MYYKRVCSYCTLMPYSHQHGLLRLSRCRRPPVDTVCRPTPRRPFRDPSAMLTDGGFFFFFVRLYLVDINFKNNYLKRCLRVVAINLFGRILKVEFFIFPRVVNAFGANGTVFFFTVSCLENGVSVNLNKSCYNLLI